jgi:hypothetical protein
MQRSEINNAWRNARACFAQHGWALPPNARWDITDFGLNDFANQGLVLINLATEPEYCEKLMYAAQGQTTPCHAHRRKKEDIICRAGVLHVWLWPENPVDPAAPGNGSVTVAIDGEPVSVPAGTPVALVAGRRVTLTPGIWHAFAPASAACIIGEVSTANDDAHDNFFVNPLVSRFPQIIEDEPAEIRLLGE